jgi:hypothetical protein
VDAGLKVMVGELVYPYPGFDIKIPMTDPVPKGPPLITGVPVALMPPDAGFEKVTVGGPEA